MVRIDFQRLRFLIVDDDVHMRRIVHQLLHGFGAREIYEAANGAAGLEVFAQTLPDILILDWSMAEMDGLDMTRSIRKPDSKLNPYVPIIMLSGHSEKERVCQARDAGVTEFLIKPVSAKGLYLRILSAVAAPRPFIKTATYFGPCRRRTNSGTYLGPERRLGRIASESIDTSKILEKITS